MATNPDTIVDPAADPAAAPPVDPATPPVAADPAASPDPAPPSPANDDWRASLAGEDKDMLRFLGRYHSKDAALKAWKTTNDEIKAGKFIKPLGDDASDEDKAAWNKMLGVPEKVDGYLENLPDGLVVGDDDRPAVDQFLNAMHEAGAPKAVSDAALAAYYSIVEEQAAEEADLIETAKQSSTDALREEWGADYRRNLNAMHNHLATLPEAVRDAFTGGRMLDGTPIGYNAEVLKWLTAQALETNPLATVVPNAGANQAGAIDDEIAGIEKVMRENRAAYNRDDKMQARYRELLGAREKLKG